MRMRKTTGLPGNEVLIPVNDKIVVEMSVKEEEHIPPAPKIARPKRKYVRKATTH